MSCFGICGLPLWRRKPTISAPPSVDHEDADQARPYTGSTANGTPTGVEAVAEEKETGPEKRSRSRSVSQRLSVPVEAFTTALRDRSRSRSKSLARSKKGTLADADTPSLPLKSEKKPIANSGKEKATRLTLNFDKTPLDDEKTPRPELDLVTVRGPAWPLKDEKEVEADSGLRKRADSRDSLNSPTSPDFSDEEKKRVVERLSTTKGDSNRDSKLKDEGLVEEVEESEEEKRQRKMREAREAEGLRRRTLQHAEELDLFQMM